MILKWLGHSCFLLTSEAGVRILMDPCAPSTGYTVGPVAVDAVTAAEPVAGRIFKVDRAVDGLARRVAVRDENLVPQQRIAVPAGFDCEETVVVL